MSTARHLEAQEAELSVLGGVLLDNTALNRVSSLLDTGDFFSPRHQIVFKAMLRLAEAQQPLDPVTLATALEQGGELDAIGGMDYLIQLSSATASAVNVEHHAGIIHDYAEVRRLIQVCEEVVKKAREGDYEDTERLFDEAQQAVYEVGQARQGRNFSTMASALKLAIERVQRAYEVKSSVTGTPTGFLAMDARTAGLQAGDLIILAARPGMGKTALALNMATNAAMMGNCSVAVFSLEMPTVQLAARILASEARVDGERMRTGHLSDGDIDRLLQAVKRMNQLTVFIDDTPSLSVMECRSKCRRLASDRTLPPLGLIVVDYLQLMKGRAGVKSREQEISEISRNLKALAKELMVPVVALSQLNRSVESRPNKRPQLSDLRESGAIEQDADIIMFVYRDEYYNEETEDRGVAEVIIGKNRSGSTGTCKLKFFKQWTRFDNLEPGEEGAMNSDERSGLDVLVVEDDALNAQLLTRFCRSLGHTPRVAGDGAAALAAVARRVPDLVLLDLMLPHIDGFGVLTHLRKDPLTARLPVIMVTAVSEPATLARLVDLGADDIVGKPFRFKELGAQIESTLAARRFVDRLSDQPPA